MHKMYYPSHKITLKYFLFFELFYLSTKSIKKNAKEKKKKELNEKETR